MKRFLATVAILSAVALGAGIAHAEPLSVAMLIPGNIEDNGFMEAGYDGLVQIRDELGARIDYIDQIKPEKAQLAQALRQLAEKSPDLVIAHGGQNDEAALEVAAEFPQIRFVVVQGHATGPNLSSYEVRQEGSAWLAGAAAGLLTRSGVVGHISGIRVPPGLKGRGGFYHGLMHTRPDARYVTIFAGDQDDNDLSRKVAKAEIAEGADIIFTMLNAGRSGATEAMKDAGIRQVGNVIDWTKLDPQVFVASAVANVSIPSVEAARDLAQGTWQPGIVKQIGLENPDAVRLALSEDVPAAVREQVDGLRDQIISGEIKVATDYDGPELDLK